MDEAYSAKYPSVCISHDKIGVGLQGIDRIFCGSHSKENHQWYNK